MGKLPLCEVFRIGKEFMKYVEETGEGYIIEKNKLKDIYSDFTKSGRKCESFSRVIFALSQKQAIEVNQDQVKFNLRPESSDIDIISITSREHSFVKDELCLTVDCMSKSEIKLEVKNTGGDPVRFFYSTQSDTMRCFTLHDDYKVSKKNTLTLNPGDTYNITVHFLSNMVGFYSATLDFEYKLNLKTSPTASVKRIIEIECMTALGKKLLPTAPYKPVIPGVITAADRKIVDPSNPPGLQQKELALLCATKVPEYVKYFVHSPDKQCFKNLRDLLKSPLCWENYVKKFKLMLFLEKLQMDMDIMKYNIPNSKKEYATIVRDKVDKNLFIMEVPGLSENHPSVLQGNTLWVALLGETCGKKYKATVESVQLDNLKLKFSGELPHGPLESMKFTIKFEYNHVTLHHQHRAVKLVTEFSLQPVLFPDVCNSKRKPQPPQLRLFDTMLNNNWEQYEAVQHIVNGSSKPAPYLVFGPPGTGKTVTLVEAIKQIENQTSAHILACAHSNSATDLLCMQILNDVEEHKVLRIYAKYLNSARIPEKLKACSNLKTQTAEYPKKEKLMEYKIIVTTLFTAGRLVEAKIPRTHFTHIFVDEAGQALETEGLIPIAGLLNPDSGLLTLAGDPQQLGPIVRSPIARKHGMGVSLLERLMNDFKQYQKQEHRVNPCFMTKLLRNYRSHPDILRIPNDLFYEKELLPCADEISRNSYCSWKHLPKKGFPVIFHEVVGLTKRESSSPSLFNGSEVEILMDYLKVLLQPESVPKISPEDIGIIAPYRKQVEKIQQALKNVGKVLKVSGKEALQVGTVEEFQGQERSVIMVSTVQSSHESIETGKKFNLGFVNNKKRFNVAITRAKALLIVVGNPKVLESDPTWKCFIQYCKDKGGYTSLVTQE
ncbi:putative helicase mov-10-B.2 isoform X2 [Thalassophryne amazonica]|uniref:putative helicase mov-10-B.2 isoform X2 n=1 Tax=Thalassophryne amazonica TaxID=390379 RepID=UPI001471C387|nr:putative helicase mov-10-B.2 isoform X2 [Thalassophryne amazonica]